MESTYYTKMMDLLSKNPLGEAYKNTPIHFFRLCQEYEWHYTVYHKISSNAGKVIQNYIDEDYGLTRRRKKESQGQGKEGKKIKNTRLNMEDKLYAEFFTKIYSQYYEKDFKWCNVVDYGEKVAWILNDYFQGANQAVPD